MDALAQILADHEAAKRALLEKLMEAQNKGLPLYELVSPLEQMLAYELVVAGLVKVMTVCELTDKGREYCTEMRG